MIHVSLLKTYKISLITLSKKKYLQQSEMIFLKEPEIQRVMSEFPLYQYSMNIFAQN